MGTTSDTPYDRSPAWVACYQLAVTVYRVTRAWPRSEAYGLTSQVRRAAYSAAANIAEGLGRRGARELRRFVDYSLGSIAELDVGLRLARDTGILDAEAWREVEALRRTAGRMTGGLSRSLRRPRQSP
jgi:four helix bundle protein